MCKGHLLGVTFCGCGQPWAAPEQLAAQARAGQGRTVRGQKDLKRDSGQVPSSPTPGASDRPSTVGRTAPRELRPWLGRHSQPAVTSQGSAPGWGDTGVHDGPAGGRKPSALLQRTAAGCLCPTSPRLGTYASSWSRLWPGGHLACEDAARSGPAARTTGPWGQDPSPVAAGPCRGAGMPCACISDKKRVCLRGARRPQGAFKRHLCATYVPPMCSNVVVLQLEKRNSPET